MELYQKDINGLQEKEKIEISELSIIINKLQEE